MNKKNKKQKAGFIDLGNPIMISVMMIIILLSVYGGLVYFGKYDYNPLNWFENFSPPSTPSASSSMPPVPNASVNNIPEIVRVPTAQLPISGNNIPEIVRVPTASPPLSTGGKLFRKFKKR